MFAIYQALYRKWRPKTFDDVVGQEHITETLKNQVSTGRLSHAYIFIGTRGTGKTSCAKILAKAINCEEPVNGNPCNRCRACLGIDDGSVMDVVEIDAASNNGVDNVRALRDEAVFSPAMVKKRVYIIDEVHMLSASAFNALLKILEEPPEHLMFILATTELHKVPATILSRCQRYSFKRLDSETIAARLNYVALQEKFDLTADAAELIAQLSEGGMRDALSMLDQCSGHGHIDTDTVYSTMGLAGRRDTLAMMEHIISHRTEDALELFQHLWQDGKDPETFLGELSALQRDILMSKVAPKGGRELLAGGYDIASLSALGSSISSQTLINNITLIQSAFSDMRSGHAKTLCELCIINLCEPQLGDGLPRLRERISALEQAISGGCIIPAAAPSSKAAFPPVKDTRMQAPLTQEAAPADSGYSSAGHSRNHQASPPSDKTGAVSIPAPARANDTAALSDIDDVPFDLAEPAPYSMPDRKPPQLDSAPSSALASSVPGSGSAAAASGSDTSGALQPTAAADDLWSGILGAIKGRLPPGICSILTDSSRSCGSVSGSDLTVYVQPGFPMNNIDRPDVISKIAAAAAEVAGKQIHVSVKEFSEQPPAHPEKSDTQKSNIDDLKKFDIVLFK